MRNSCSNSKSASADPAHRPGPGAALIKGRRSFDTHEAWIAAQPADPNYACRNTPGEDTSAVYLGEAS